MERATHDDYPPDLDEQQSDYLLSNVKDWSIAHGLAVRPPTSFISSANDPTGVVATTAPVTLFPSLFPRACFQEAHEIQEAYNELYAAVSSDEEWLRGIVEEYASPASLWQSDRAVRAACRQKKRLSRLWCTGSL